MTDLEGNQSTASDRFRGYEKCKHFRLFVFFPPLLLGAGGEKGEAILSHLIVFTCGKESNGCKPERVCAAATAAQHSSTFSSVPDQAIVEKVISMALGQEDRLLH